VKKPVSKFAFQMQPAALHPGSLLWAADFGPLTYGQILTVVYLKVSLSGYLSVFATRTVGPCYEVRLY
jgi:hypothetical protein